MIELLYGTGNPAKLAAMRRALAALPVRVVGPADLGVPAPEIAESGGTPPENARLKAEGCFRAFRRPVFACDSGLYFDRLPEALQPGTHVRRVGGKTLTDAEMTDYYAALARRYGPLRGRYRNAVCFTPDGVRFFERMSAELSGGAFVLVGTPHARREPGFPLDCLSVEPESGNYYYDLGVRLTDETAQNRGFARFFAEALEELKWL